MLGSRLKEGPRLTAGSHVVQMYAFPGGEFEGNVTRFNLPVNAIEFSSDGQLLAAAGEDDHIRIVSLSDNSIFRQIRTTFGPVKSLAYDPEGIYMACVSYDGTLEVWDIEENASVFRKKKSVDPSTGPTPSCAISWAKDGSCIYLPGSNGCVWKFMRRTWLESRLCEGKHLKALACVAVSTCGRFLASADVGGKLVVWSLSKERALSETDIGSSVSSIAWSSDNDVLAALDVDGQYFLWKDMTLRKHGDKSKDREIVTAEKEDPKDFLSDEAVDDDEKDVDDPHDFEDDSRGSLDDFIDDGDNDQEGTAPQSERRRRRAADRPYDPLNTYRSASLQAPQRQDAFQPSVTPVESGRRFLAYTMDGCITSRFVPESGHYSIDISFHDTAKHPARIPMMTDYYGYTVAAFGENGAVFAAPQRSEKSNSVVMFRPFDGWSSNDEWIFHLPIGEEVVCTALGDSWVACGTSKQLLRIFSSGGIQSSILALPGPIVSMAGHGERLMVVWHCGCPISGPSGVEQQLEFAVYTLSDSRKLFGGRVAMSPGSELTWVGWTEAGVPATFDSEGELLLFNSSFGGTWTPVFSAKRERKSTSERYWIVGITSTQLHCVVCKAPATTPQVMPRPVLSRVDLSAPTLASDPATVDLEKQNLLHNVNLENARGVLGVRTGNSGQEDALRVLQASADKCKLRLFASACSADRLPRAYSLAESLNLQKALQGALEIANRSKLYSLSSKLQVLLENRMHLDTLRQAHLRTPAATGKTMPSESPVMETPDEIRTPGLRSDTQDSLPSNLNARNWDSLDRPTNPFLRPKKVQRQ